MKGANAPLFVNSPNSSASLFEPVHYDDYHCFFGFYNSIMGLMVFKFASSEAPYHDGNEFIPFIMQQQIMKPMYQADRPIRRFAIVHSSGPVVA
jgi:hypothetical protein